MKKLILTSLILAFTFTANATEVVKTGEIWINQSRTIRVSFESYKPAPFFQKTNYTPFVKADLVCDSDTPEHCDLSIGLNVAKAHIEIIGDDTTLAKSGTVDIIASGAIPCAVVDHKCVNKLPSNQKIELTYTGMITLFDQNDEPLFFLTLLPFETFVEFDSKGNVLSFTPFNTKTFQLRHDRNDFWHAQEGQIYTAQEAAKNLKQAVRED